jgi:gas vesicle protein
MGRDDSAVFAAGLFMGVAIGIMGALLFAPKSGRRLRRQIAREGRKLQHRTAEAVDELREQGSELLESAREAVSDARAELKSR